LQSKKPIAAPVGTTIEVEDLFYNTPARRKFLKAESTEARHISRFTTALAIGRPDIGISFSLNGRKVFAQRTKESLQERVSQILGGTNRKFIAVEGESGVVKISGYIGTPETVQHNRFGQFIFINNRYIASSTLSHAFNAGYEELLPRGQYPVGALLLTVDPVEVDVNVHPAKTEVRLSHEREIHDAIYRTVRDTLRQDGVIPSLDSTRRGAAPFNKKPASFDPDASGVAKSNYIPGLDARPKGDYKFISKIFKGVKGEQVRGQSEEIIKVDKQTGEIIEDKTLPESAIEKPETNGPSGGFRFIGCFSGLYLLIQAGNDLYVVDQHTAHERVLYEEILPGIENQSINSQQLLFPVQVELTPEQLAVFDESCEFINRSGFQVSPFGGRMVNIEAVPIVLSKKSPEKLFLKIIDDLATLRKSGHDIKKAIAQSIACRSAVMAGDHLSNEEAIYLLDTLLNCENGYCCPHGRPTFIKINRSDLDRQFGRI